MSVEVKQRDATRNQSTVDYKLRQVFLFKNRYQEGNLVNDTGAEKIFKDGYLVVRDSGAFEKATVKFNATSLSAGQTIIIAGLTYTSTAVTTQSQLAAAFASLSDGATTGGGTATGTYSGTLTGYNTGAASNGEVVFTASTVGSKTNLAVTGTGAAATVNIVKGRAGVPDGFTVATASNLADIIGIAKVGMLDLKLDINQDAPANYCIEGDIDSTELIFPATVNLTTMVGNKTLKDVLTGMGFVLHKVEELTKFDN